MTYGIRPARHEDARMVFDWRNQDRVRLMMFSPDMIAWEDHLRWFERSLHTHPAPVWIFEWQGRPMGVVQLSHWDPGQGSCHWGYYIGDPEAPKGAGTLMGVAALTHIFEKQGIRKLMAEVLDDNERSRNYLLNLGFQELPVRFQAIELGGKLHDIHTFQMLATDWTAQKPSLESKAQAIIEKNP